MRGTGKWQGILAMIEDPKARITDTVGLQVGLLLQSTQDICESEVGLTMTSSRLCIIYTGGAGMRICSSQRL